MEEERGLVRHLDDRRAVTAPKSKRRVDRYEVSDRTSDISVSGVLEKPASAAIERAKRRDPRALEEFFERHVSSLFGYFSGPMHWHWTMVPDLVQETIARAIKAFPDLRGTTDVQAERWLFGIARHVHMQEVSKQVGIRLRQDVAVELRRQLPEATDPCYGRDIVAALEGLPLGELEVLRLVLEGLTIREIALELDVPDGTVATRIHRARKRLRARLGIGVP
jgi:RNA polymerase sigma-70 factor (ECF subfamily)